MVKIDREKGLARAFFEIERHRVNAPSLICRNVVAFTGKDVTEMRVTFGAADFGSDSRSQ
jgi:hypothetical protein